MCVLQEIDSIEVSADTTPAAATDNGIDVDIPVIADSDSVTAVLTPADSGQQKVTATASKPSSQHVNDVNSDDEDEWKQIPPQGASMCIIIIIIIIQGRYL